MEAKPPFRRSWQLMYTVCSPHLVLLCGPNTTVTLRLDDALSDVDVGKRIQRIHPWRWTWSLISWLTVTTTVIDGLIWWYGIYMVFIWYLYGIYMVFIWYLYGIYMVFIWYLYGIYMIFIWYLYGIYMMIAISCHMSFLKRRWYFLHYQLHCWGNDKATTVWTKTYSISSRLRFTTPFGFRRKKKVPQQYHGKILSFFRMAMNEYESGAYRSYLIDPNQASVFCSPLQIILAWRDVAAPPATLCYKQMW